MERSQKGKRLVPLYGQVDERTRQVAYQGDAYMGRFTVFSLLIAVALRGLPLDLPLVRDNWDLMLIVIVGGAISTIYQVKQRVMFNEKPLWHFGYVLGLMLLCAVIAVLILITIF